jgi:peptidoglycan/LPS O-acetylase OafA/YrhL
MSTNRIHYIDWLRLSAVLAVVVFHALLPFGSFIPWPIENVDQSEALGLITALLPFSFPIFVLLAGASARYALQTRSGRAFVTERAARLLVPFVVGTLVLVPLTGYVIALYDGSAPDSFLAYLAGYPGSLIDNSLKNVGFSPQVFQVVGMHLYFLAWLFLFSLLALPLFAYLSTSRGRSIVDRLVRLAQWPGGTLLFALPLAVIAFVMFGISAPVGWDWAAFGLWGGTFVGGYLLFSDDRLLAAARRDLLPALAAAAVGVAGLAATGFTNSIFRGGAHTYDATYVVLVSLHGLTVWAVTLSVLSTAMRVRFMQRPLNPGASAVALPIYLLHLPIVITISAVVVEWPLALWPKALVNVGLGLAATLLVATIAIRVPVIRRLLGVRRVQPEAVQRTPAPPAVLPSSPG